MKSTSNVSESPKQGVAQLVLSPRFLRVLGWTYALAALLLWVTLAVQWAGGNDRNPAPSIGPDFPAFYTAGWMVRNGESDHLYDFKRQMELQRQWRVNAHKDDLSAWVHPPHGALLLAPLSGLPPRLAYGVYSVFLVGCFIVGLLFLKSVCPQLSQPQLHGLWVLALLSSPVYFSISAGQNTGLMFLLHCTALVALARGRDISSGTSLAIGLLKPHLFLPLLPYHLAAKRWKPVLVWAVGTALVVTISIWWFGADVFQKEWRALASPLYQRFEIEHAYKMFSWPAFWKLLIGANQAATVLGGLCALAVFWRMVWLWSRVGTQTDAVLLGALSVASVVLIIPHLPVYDLGLLVIPVLVILDRLLSHPDRPFVALKLALLGLVFFCSLADEWAHTTRVQIVVPLLTYIWWQAQELLFGDEDIELASGRAL